MKLFVYRHGQRRNNEEQGHGILDRHKAEKVAWQAIWGMGASPCKE